ncbi:MAG: hypothetical protein Kow0075_02230 [Salibacteraceae bacterium]
MQSKRNTFFLLSGIVLVAALSRLIPHPMNMAPLGAMALFGAAYFRKPQYALGAVIAAWWISDLVLNNLVYPTQGTLVWFTEGALFIYLSIVAIYAFGKLVFRNKVDFKRVIVGSLGASVIFFILSNFGVWLSGTLYPPTIEGLTACYTMALPFFKNTLVGDLVYSGLLFTGYAWLLSKNLITQKVSS